MYAIQNLKKIKEQKNHSYLSSKIKKIKSLHIDIGHWKISYLRNTSFVIVPNCVNRAMMTATKMNILLSYYKYRFWSKIRNIRRKQSSRKIWFEKMFPDVEDENSTVYFFLRKAERSNICVSINYYHWLITTENHSKDLKICDLVFTKNTAIKKIFPKYLFFFLTHFHLYFPQSLAHEAGIIMSLGPSNEVLSNLSGKPVKLFRI